MQPCGIGQIRCHRNRSLGSNGYLNLGYDGGAIHYSVQSRGATMTMTSRLWRGGHSAVANMCWPLGGWCLSGLKELREPQRRSQGLAIVLPGVEGRSTLNWSIAQGIDDSGFPGSIEIRDWTTGFWPFFLYHLRAHHRNRAQAAAIAREIIAYQDEHPGHSTYLIGHSGGAAMAAWVLEELPAGRTVTAAAMLGPALPCNYPLATALSRVEQALWSFWTPLDVLYLGVGTLACGNLDGSHAPSGGWVGFRPPPKTSPAEQALYQSRLRQCRFEPSMLGQGHFGGHMSWANRLFVAEEVAPRVFGERPSYA